MVAIGSVAVLRGGLRRSTCGRECWIFLSDTLLVFIHPEWTIRDLTWLQTAKGLIFVIATAVMLYVLVRRAMQQIGESHKVLQESQDHFRRMVELSPNGVFVQMASSPTPTRRC